MESVDESANARTNSPFRDTTSSKLLPRVSISNIKSPSKRHSLLKENANRDLALNWSSVLDWLPEVKQFVSFFNIHFYVRDHYRKVVKQIMFLTRATFIGMFSIKSRSLTRKTCWNKSTLACTKPWSLWSPRLKMGRHPQPDLRKDSRRVKSSRSRWYNSRQASCFV